jgi:hypothetical protein
MIFVLVSMVPILKTYGVTAAIAVDPPISIVQVGDVFNININVSNIVNFTCWELNLYFLRGVLNCTAAVEGPFLKTGGGTFYNKTITNNFNATHGRLFAYSTLLGATSVAGGGTILIVTFKAVGVGSTPLRMADIHLYDEKIPPKDILHNAYDGSATATGGTGHDVAVTRATNSKKGCLPEPSVSQGQPVRINATVENQGAYSETFDVSCYATNASGSYLLDQAPVSLNAYTSTNVTLVWVASGFSIGTYDIAVSAHTVLGETDTSDNNCSDGNVHVTLIGDTNVDDYVGIDDVFSIASHFAQMPSDPYWNPNCDINDDDYIGSDDIFMTASHFGDTYP